MQAEKSAHHICKGNVNVANIAAEDFILSLLSGFNIKSTFFILGCVAERTPDLVRMIHHEGHDVACHGYGHDITINLSDEELRIDISRAKSVLEDIYGSWRQLSSCL